MIRKPPLKTYLKKKTAQSSFCYSQPDLWEPRSFSKRISTNGRKNKSQSPQDIEDIQDLSSSFLETTFDRIAKNARLPPPPQQESHSLINISSDIPNNEPSLVKTDVIEYQLTKESGKSKASKRAKRKSVQSRRIYPEMEVVVKKRLKHDLINTSTKKDKVTRSSRRKVSAKADKNVTQSRKKEGVQLQGSTLDSSEDWFVVQPVENTKMTEKQNKKKNGYRLRRKKNVESISHSTSTGNDSNSNCNADVNEEKTKSKKKNIISRRNADRKKSEVFDSIDTALKELNDSSKLQVKNEDVKKRDCSIDILQEIENQKSSLVESCFSSHTNKIVSRKKNNKAQMRNSPALNYSENFRRYSASKSRENDEVDTAGFHEYNRILTRKEYTSKVQPKLPRKNNSQKSEDTLDNLNNSKMVENHIAQEKDLAIKPCFVVLRKCNENDNPILGGNKSAQVLSQNYSMHSSEDIIQCSISNAASNVKPEINAAMKIKLYKAAATQEAQSIKNQPDFIDYSDLNIEPNKAKIAEESIERKQQPNQLSYYLICSTPINPYMKINSTINCLSPIITNDDTSPVNNEIVDEKGVHETSVGNCTANITNRSEEYLDLPKTKTRRKSIRKKLSVSYSEDKSLDMSDEYLKKNRIAEIPIENVKNHQYSSGPSNSKQIKSPTSEIQESLEILKLNLDNSINKSDTDHKGKRQLSLKEIVSTNSNGSNRIFESTNKYDDTNEFTGQSKDTCSQLTPIGILTTRSGRQLKLNTSTQKKFFNDSNDSKIHSEIDNEIIDDSESTRNKNLGNQINKHRGSRFTVWKSPSKHNGWCDHGSGCAKRVPAISISKTQALKNSMSHKSTCSNNISKTRASNNSTSHKSTTLYTSKKSKTISLHRQSKCSTEDYGKESRINSSTSIVADSQNRCAASFDQDISQSIIESTKNLDSLNIGSPVDVKEETMSNDGEASDSEWSTLSGSENIDSATSNLEEKIKEDSCQRNKLQTASISSSEGSLLADQNKLDNGSSSKESHNTSESASVSSPENTAIALAKRMELLSTRINTRKRRKTFFKPVTQNMSQVFQGQSAAQTSDHSKLTNSINVCSRNRSDLEEEDKIGNVVHSLDKPEDSGLLVEPLYVNLNTNLEPVVLIEKLEDPLKMTTNQRQDWDYRPTTIHETSNKTLRIIGKNSADSFTINDEEVNEDDEDFVKSDPLYCPPERFEMDNSLIKEETMSSLHADCSFSKSDIRVDELMARQCVLASLRQCLLDRSEKDNSSFKANQTLPRKYRKRNSSKSNYSASKFDVSDPEMAGRQSLFLKPGKEWARSLSILNNIQNGSNLEQLSTGKGKNWRQSVQTIIAMQQEGLVQSCLGKNENDKNTQRCLRPRNSSSIPSTPLCSEEQSIRSASPSRFIRRMSIRVVPDDRRPSHIEDTSFLEAYGITASKSRKTLSRASQFESSKKTLTDKVECEDAAIETDKTEQVVTAKDVVLQRCDQDNYLPFSKCFPAKYLEHCRKIGEGVYGEVFLYEHENEKSVIKIIPIEGDVLVNGERQKRFDEILSEIVIAKELHDLRNGDKNQTHGFVEVKNIRCIKGKYPAKLIELWKTYDNDKGSDNDCPSMFDRHQLYIALELGHGGEDLEAFVFHSAIEAHALFLQAAVALAVAEQSLEFEHRDLHWGNILISETKDSEVTYQLNNKEYKYPTKGLQVAIIDFTLSRMSYDGCCIFNDLAMDPALFTAEGEYQFEVYRLMRDKVGNNWQKFEPYTNILWLHYIIDKMMTSLRYKRIYAKGHRGGLFWLHELKKIVLNYESAFDFVTNCEKITNCQCKSTDETTDDDPIIIEFDDQK